MLTHKSKHNSVLQTSSLMCVLNVAAVAKRLRLQPLGRLRDGENDEGEAVLRRLQHRTGAETCTGDHRAG